MISILPRQPGDPLGIEDWLFLLSIIAGLLILVFIVFPAINAIMTPAPDQIVRFYANGTALLGNGTLINLSNIKAIY
jgi:hypothetical protein